MGDLFIILAILAIAAVGGLVSGGNNDPWYAGLYKPPGTPLPIVFAIVWPVLYVLMALSAVFVRRKMGGFQYAPNAFGIFFLQLAFNGAWSVLFFFFHRPVWALIDIVALWLLIVATIFHFGRISKFSAVLLFPYFIWVSFAIYLNAMIVWLNFWPIF